MFPNPMGGVISKIFPTTLGVAVVPWYLSGGVTAGQCVAAYAAKGAASYAASKVNLNNPGTYDCTDGAAFPTWAAGTGWTFVIASSQYLLTGFTPSLLTHSMIVKFDGSGVGGTQCISGTSNNFLQLLNASGIGRVYRNGGTTLSAAPSVASGILCVTATNGYYNGASDGACVPVSMVGADALMIGRRNGATPSYYGGNITSLAVYSISLSIAQVAAIGTAMP